MANPPPLIGVPADRRKIDPHVYHIVGEKYLTPLTDLAAALPFPIPALAGRLELQWVLERVDGLLLTGSHSNVEPWRYQGSASEPGTLHDAERDAVTLELIPAAIERGIPVFAICRGLQEMNVAFGGSLHQKVHEVPGMLDHREDATQPLDVQYGPAHEVELVRGGALHDLLASDRIEVNSVHCQGVDRLGDGLRVEARAPDGLIEALSVVDAPGFNIAVQWHPEWKAVDNSVSRALFAAFGEACSVRAHTRSGQ